MMQSEKILRLYAAPAAVTDTTAAVLWDKPEWSAEVDGYAVYKNGVCESVAPRTFCMLEKLQPDTGYTVAVCAILKDGTFTPLSEPVIVKTKPEPEVFDITHYGAVADGSTLNTGAIQAAIDACTPNGRVYVPRGVFRTGALFLKSNMTLYLERGAKLLGSTELEDYPVFQYRFEGREQPCYASLINTPMGTERVRNITIDGEGSIDASGSILMKKMEQAGGAARGRAVCLRRVDGLYLKDVTIRQSPAWCTHLIYCTDVSVNGVFVNSNFDEYGVEYGLHNGDGLNPDSCRHVRIFNTTIASQDDCIAIKSGKNEEGRRVGIPSEDIRITNCRFLSGFGVCCGSEMSGCVRDVLVQDCTFENVFSVGSLKTMRGRGGVVERITYDSCVHYQRNYHYRDGIYFRGALYIDTFYGGPNDGVDLPMPVDEGTPLIRDIVFKNIVLDTVSGNAVYISGLAERHVENIHLENITGLGNHAMVTHHVDNLTMKNVRLFGRDGSKV